MFNKKHFVFDNIPDLSGKVAIVTGGNNGIGFITVRELARKNAHVFIASRNKEKGESAVEQIKKETKNNAVEFLQLDLQSLNSVKNAAETFLARNLPLHILVNNAGIMATPFETTEDGIQDQFGVNHLGHFLFTILLLPTIKVSAPSRIVNVSSLVHNRAKGIDFDKLNDPNAYTPFERYYQAKLANILFTTELAKRLTETNTDLYGSFVSSFGSWIKPLVSLGTFFMLTPNDGALTQLYCATSPEIEEKNHRGKYFIPFGELGQTNAPAKDEELAKTLWNFSEKFIKEKLGDGIFSKCYD
ncbi:1999_t:CDS:2 [Cetraspora pellucida]|uniref:1999_t:CDS:1 n=1 Tax=Cetraspora pellucida TaxID=1433469 RepID=A0ACA9L8Y3_9GLOM|nr:1999_t:CDS:2 [Cetraspora pellucida]